LGSKTRIKGDLVGFNDPLQHIIGHFGDESFQSITCTGTDNQKEQPSTEHINNIKITQPKKSP